MLLFPVVMCVCDDLFPPSPPPCRADSYQDYLPSLSGSDEAEGSIITEPSTPSSYCPTPDMSSEVGVRLTHIHSASLPEVPYPSKSNEELTSSDKKLSSGAQQRKPLKASGEQE